MENNKKEICGSSFLPIHVIVEHVLPFISNREAYINCLLTCTAMKQKSHTVTTIPWPNNKTISNIVCFEFVSSLAFTNNSDQILIATQSQIDIVESQCGTICQTLNPISNSNTFRNIMAPCPCNDNLVAFNTTADNNNLHLWNRKLNTIKALSRINSDLLTWSKDGKYIVYSHIPIDDNVVMNHPTSLPINLYDIQKQKVTTSLQTPQSPNAIPLFMSCIDNDTIAVVYAIEQAQIQHYNWHPVIEYQIGTWHLAQNTNSLPPRFTIQHVTYNRISCFAACMDWLAVAFDDGTFSIYNHRNKNERMAVTLKNNNNAYNGSKTTIHSILFDWQSNLITGDAMGRIRLWTITPDNKINCTVTIQAHSSSIKSMCLSPCGTTLASCGSHVRLLDYPISKYYNYDNQSTNK